MLLPILLGLAVLPLALSSQHSHNSVCITDTVPVKLSTGHGKHSKLFDVSPRLQEIRSALCAGKCTSKQAGPEFKRARFSEWGALGEASGKHCEISFPLNNETEAYILRSTESGNDDKESCLDITSQIIHDCVKDGPNVGRVEETPDGACYEAGVRLLSEPAERPGRADTAHAKIMSFLKHPKGNKPDVPKPVRGTPAKGNPDATHHSHNPLQHPDEDSPDGPDDGEHHEHHGHPTKSHSSHKSHSHGHPKDEGSEGPDDGEHHVKHHSHPTKSHSSHKSHSHSHPKDEGSEGPDDGEHHVKHHSHTTGHKNSGHKHPAHQHPAHKHPDHQHPDHTHHSHTHPNHVTGEHKHHGDSHQGHGSPAKSKSAPSKKEAIQQVEDFLKEIKQSFTDFQSCDDPSSSKCQSAINTFISADSDIETLTDVLSVIGFPEDEEITIPLRGLEALLKVIVKKIGKNRKVTKKVFDAVSGTIKTLQKSIHDVEDVLDKVESDLDSSQPQTSESPSIPLPDHLGSIPLPKLPSFGGLGNILAEKPNESGHSRRAKDAKTKDSGSKSRGPAEPNAQHVQVKARGHGPESVPKATPRNAHGDQHESDRDAEANDSPPQSTSEDSIHADASDQEKRAFADLLSLPDIQDDEDDDDNEEEESAAGRAQEKNEGDAWEGEPDGGQEDDSEADTEDSDGDSASPRRATESSPSTLDWTFMKPDGQLRDPKRKSDSAETNSGPDEPERARKPKHSKRDGRSADINGEEGARR